MTTGPIDLTDYKRVREDLKLSVTDSLIVLQMISAFDYVSDAIVDMSEAINKLHHRIEYLEADVGWLLGGDEDGSKD